MYVPSLISIPFVLSKICTGQANIMKNWLRGDNYRIGLWFLCTARSLTAIYLYTKFYLNPFSTFQDMARTGIHYEKNKWEITM